jgi:hypothetical protein
LLFFTIFQLKWFFSTFFDWLMWHRLQDLEKNERFLTF